MRCPRCRTGLVPERGGKAQFHRCVSCRGLAINLAVVRQFAPADRVQALWRGLERGRRGDACPSCSRPLLLADAQCGAETIELDACRACQLIWFDADELAAFSPSRQTVTPSEPRLSPSAAEALALARIEADASSQDAADQAVIGTEIGLELLSAILRSVL